MFPGHLSRRETVCAQTMNFSPAEGTGFISRVQQSPRSATDRDSCVPGKGGNGEAARSGSASCPPCRGTHDASSASTATSRAYPQSQRDKGSSCHCTLERKAAGSLAKFALRVAGDSSVTNTLSLWEAHRSCSLLSPALLQESQTHSPAQRGHSSSTAPQAFQAQLRNRHKTEGFLLKQIRLRLAEEGEEVIARQLFTVMKQRCRSWLPVCTMPSGKTAVTES